MVHGRLWWAMPESKSANARQNGRIATENLIDIIFVIPAWAGIQQSRNG